MTATLDVYLHTDLVGYLIQDEHGQTLFQYSPAWLASPQAFPLSLSLPLQKESFGEKQCKPFFVGVLPDNAKRTAIARNLGISANNDFAMLREIGGECAGAITFVNAGEKLSEHENDYKLLSAASLVKILVELPKRPLMAGEEGVRLSLAGAQDKIAVYKSESGLCLPLNNAPSSHILKPDIEAYKGMVFNEAFCMKLAAKVGLPVPTVETATSSAVDYLLIERYDRIKVHINNKVRLDRIHQEDFCQALGIVSDRKYQTEGGPAIKDCFDLVRSVSSIPVLDLKALLDAVIFNFLIGNNDAHGKNFSLLHRKPGVPASVGRIRLAPFYDLICTALYPDLSKKMAMKIGGASGLDEVDARQLEKLAEQIGFAKPLVKQRVVSVAEKVLESLSEVVVTHPVADEVRAFVGNHCKSVIQRFSV